MSACRSFQVSTDERRRTSPITQSTDTYRQSITVDIAVFALKFSAATRIFLAEEASRSTKFPVVLPQHWYPRSRDVQKYVEYWEV